MTSGRLTEGLYVGWKAISRHVLTVALLWGALIGVLVVSTSLSWTLTWGDDRAMASAAILILACGLITGSRFSLSRFFGQCELAVGACTWALLQPWLMPELISLMRYVSASWLGAESSRLAIGLVYAVPAWFLPGWCWSSLAIGVFGLGHCRRCRESLVAGQIAMGIALGLGMSAFALAPWLGSWGTVVVAVAIVIAARAIGGATPISADSVSSRSGLPFRFELINFFAAGAIGCLLAVTMRLTGQLMPDTPYVCHAEWMGLAIGFAIGQVLKGTRSHSVASVWPLLVPAAAGAMFLAILPAIVGSSLWVTASLASVFLLVAFRACLLILVTASMGYALSGLSSTQNAFDRWYAVSTVAVGFVGMQFCFEWISVTTLLTTISITLIVMGVSRVALMHRHRLSWQSLTGIACLSILGLSVPLWRSHDNPAVMTKLLFSTPTFVAYRAGWDSQLLTTLDDARAVHVQEGIHGPLTLWRSHGLELHLRENGIPRAVISTNTEMHPQFAPEVLQAVLPLILAPEPNRILLLGASDGVPMATCLQFPIHQLVCAENDRQLIGMIRGTIAQETGSDPLADERTMLVNVPPSMAVMSPSETYDVILSSPPSSSIVAGGAFFTVDHYQRASKCLTTNGIFCQRFQCIDYGPDPLRMVVHSMRQAFQDVVAVETAAGEFLLLGANTKGLFVPDDLAARLEAPHVKRLLARSGLDWSAILNFPAYDHQALAEVCAEGHGWTNSAANGILALRAPLELMRWGPKLQEVQTVLTSIRTSVPNYLTDDQKTALAEGEGHLLRKSRLLEWLGDSRVSPELLRRLSEVATQQKLVQENPESHWWEYRNALRQQLQNRPRQTVKQVNHVAGTSMHPEDERRKGYFTALGLAAHEPTERNIGAVESHLQPYDPLVSYFARQEIADLQARGQINPASELAHRLHVVYFAPGTDASTRNVASTLELLVRSPETIPDPAKRFDMINGLLQTLRSRWEARQSHPVKSARRQLTDIDRSFVAVDKAVQALEALHADAEISDVDWKHRKQVIERMLLRPLHAYRTQLQVSANRNEGRTPATTDAELNPPIPSVANEKPEPSSPSGS